MVSDEQDSGRPNVRGIDHVGLTVPDLEEATRFLVDALGAEVTRDILKKSDPARDSAEVQRRLGIPSTVVQRAIRVLRLPDGLLIELFEYEGPEQRDAVVSSDVGWQHVAFYAEDMDAALARVEAAGGIRNSDPTPFSGGLTEGSFVYVRTPWGSTLELISYPKDADSR
jgi:catechol 2,3-dioxygenase-like lactoylglutathione lyase family enzyme